MAGWGRKGDLASSRSAAAQFTLGEAAVLAVIAEQVRKSGSCSLPVAAIAALAGVCVRTVRTAQREAERQGLMTIEERRLTGWRNAPNIIRIIAPEWKARINKGVLKITPIEKSTPPEAEALGRPALCHAAADPHHRPLDNIARPQQLLCKLF